MEIHFQTTDHVVAVEKVAEQHMATKYSKCNSLAVISHIIILGKSANYNLPPASQAADKKMKM